MSGEASERLDQVRRRLVRRVREVFWIAIGFVVLATFRNLTPMAVATGES